MKAPNSQEHLKQLNDLNALLQEKKQQLNKLQKEANQLKTKHHLNSQIEKVSAIFNELNTTVGKKIQTAGKSDGTVSGDKEEQYKQQLNVAYQEMLTYIQSMQTEYQGKAKHAKHLTELESKIKQLDSEVKGLTEKKQHKVKHHNEEVVKYQQYMQQHHQEISKQRKVDDFEHLMKDKKKQIEKLHAKSSSFDEQTRAAQQLKISLPKMKKCTFDLKHIEYFFALDINPPQRQNQIPEIIEKIDKKLIDIAHQKEQQEKTQKSEYATKLKNILEGFEELEAYRLFKKKELGLDDVKETEE